MIVQRIVHEYHKRSPLTPHESQDYVSNAIRRITSVDDMIQIMIVGNQLYSTPLLLPSQSTLMITEFSGMATVFDRFFQLEYSERYTCKMHCDTRIEGYHTVYATGYSI